MDESQARSATEVDSPSSPSARLRSRPATFTDFDELLEEYAIEHIVWPDTDEKLDAYPATDAGLGDPRYPHDEKRVRDFAKSALALLLIAVVGFSILGVWELVSWLW